MDNGDDDDVKDERISYVDDFLHSLFNIIGACMQEGDDATVSVNGMPIMTFKATPFEDALDEAFGGDIPEEKIEQFGDTEVFNLADWRPKGDKN